MTESGDKPFRKDVLIKDGFIEAVTENTADGSGRFCRRKSSTRRGCRDAGIYRYHRHCDIDALYNPNSAAGDGAGAYDRDRRKLRPGADSGAEKYRRAIYDFIEPCLSALRLKRWL